MIFVVWRLFRGIIKCVRTIQRPKTTGVMMPFWEWDGNWNGRVRPQLISPERRHAIIKVIKCIQSTAVTSFELAAGKTPLLFRAHFESLWHVAVGYLGAEYGFRTCCLFGSREFLPTIAFWHGKSWKSRIVVSSMDCKLFTYFSDR